MESQLKLNEERIGLRNSLAEALPGFMNRVSAVTDEAYKDGALSTKVKRLIALGVGLRAGCTNCILAQTLAAIEAGATRDEILETISVEVSISGTTGTGESLRVVKLLQELGRL